MYLLQGRMPYVRAMSMEQRWQDLASLLSLPDPNNPHHPHPHHHPYHHHFHHPSAPAYPSERSVLLHNASLPQPPAVSELNATSPYQSLGQWISWAFKVLEKLIFNWKLNCIWTKGWKTIRLSWNQWWQTVKWILWTIDYGTDYLYLILNGMKVSKWSNQRN